MAGRLVIYKQKYADESDIVDELNKYSAGQLLHSLLQGEHLTDFDDNFKDVYYGKALLFFTDYPQYCHYAPLLGLPELRPTEFFN